MNKIKKASSSTKNFVRRHKVALAITGTASTCLYLNRLALKQHHEFLKEKGLYDEFYALGEFAEE